MGLRSKTKQKLKRAKAKQAKKASVLGGAGTGAMVGAQFGPYGAIAGAGIGALMGAFS